MAEQNSLLDRLRGNKAAQSIQPQMTDETGRLQSLFRAKTGKAVGPEAGPAASTLQEQVAVQRGAQQLAAISAEEDRQMEGLQQEELFREQQAAQEETQLDDRAVAIQEQYMQRASGLMQSFINQGRDLDLSKRKAQVEQTGFALRLNNEKYINDLQQAGARARLEDAIEFQEALQRTIFADELDLLNGSLSFQRMLDQDSREFKMDMANLDVNLALSVAEAQAAAANTATMYSAGSTMVSEGLKYGASLDYSDTGNDDGNE